MHPFLAVLLALSAAQPLVAQTSTPTAPTVVMAKDDKGGTVVYPVSPATAYRAALTVAATQGVVTLSDKDSGVISVNIGSSKQQGRQARLSITVSSEAEDKTTVQVTTQGFQFGLSGWGDGRATKKYFDALTKEIASKQTEPSK